MLKEHRSLIIFLLLFSIVLVWSTIHPFDRFTWWLEVMPALIGVFILLFTYRLFTFTTLVYFLVLIHSSILFIGGHYTYAEMPLFNWLKEIWGLDRNYYDRLGHFAQGFIPAIIIRELLIRTSPLRNSKWLPVIVVSMCLAISAVYELVEFFVAILTGEAAEAFLGTQGDVWDTQWDMLLALIGSVTSYVTLRKIHLGQIMGMKK
ncbi:putative membrane protein [Bacillus sp. SORGH_AS 510]|uniref:DUF2238 domain-containing protein n=1 Tax=Bacillus sp. SORGH_AS_0510 TaxID=3041771 RepID=UPI002780F98B|nr:DUF2238 domain-containing protein [Bacillus sp. SORGH_AS_0510]MDQ1145548.1 putative membrane protein [Bacillus sp. SORGH_AS_0510]